MEVTSEDHRVRDRRQGDGRVTGEIDVYREEIFGPAPRSARRLADPYGNGTAAFYTRAKVVTSRWPHVDHLLDHLSAASYDLPTAE